MSEHSFVSSDNDAEEVLDAKVARKFVDTESPEARPMHASNEIITISSDNAPTDKVTDRPWKDMNDEQRIEWEKIYLQVPTQALAGDWSRTEHYLEERDNQMSLYNTVVTLSDTTNFADAETGTSWTIQSTAGFCRKRTSRKATSLCGKGKTFVAWATRFLGTRSTSPLLKPRQQCNRKTRRTRSGVASRKRVWQHPCRPKNEGVPPSLRTSTTAEPCRRAHVSRSTPKLCRQSPSRLTRRTSRSFSYLLRSSPDSACSDVPPQGYLAFTGPPSASIRVPPYPHTAPKVANRSDVFPWNRGLDFVHAKANAKWDSNYLNPQIAKEMQRVRMHNAALVVAADGTPRPQKTIGGITCFVEGSDFAFATKTDEKDAIAICAAHSLQASIETILQAAEDGQIPLASCGHIKIRLNPAKNGGIENLDQIQFTIRDSVLTRQRVTSTPILTGAAAMGIIDYCPDLLYRNTLLRITAEAGWCCSDIRTRVALNGMYLNKAAIYSRTAAALSKISVKYRPSGKNESPQPEFNDSAAIEAKIEAVRGDFHDYKRFFCTNPQDGAAQEPPNPPKTVEDKDASNNLQSKPGNSSPPRNN